MCKIYCTNHENAGSYCNVPMYLGTYFVKGLGSECKFNLGHMAGATAWEEHFKWKKSIYFLLQNVINHTI